MAEAHGAVADEEAAAPGAELVAGDRAGLVGRRGEEAFAHGRWTAAPEPRDLRVQLLAPSGDALEDLEAALRLVDDRLVEALQIGDQVVTIDLGGEAGGRRHRAGPPDVVEAAVAEREPRTPDQAGMPFVDRRGPLGSGAWPWPAVAAGRERVDEDVVVVAAEVEGIVVVEQVVAIERIVGIEIDVVVPVVVPVGATADVLVVVEVVVAIEVLVAVVVGVVGRVRHRRVSRRSGFSRDPRSPSGSTSRPVVSRSWAILPRGCDTETARPGRPRSQDPRAARSADRPHPAVPSPAAPNAGAGHLPTPDFAPRAPNRHRIGVTGPRGSGAARHRIGTDSVPGGRKWGLPRVAGRRTSRTDSRSVVSRRRRPRGARRPGPRRTRARPAPRRCAGRRATAAAGRHRGSG